MTQATLRQVYLRADRLMIAVIWSLVVLTLCLAPLHDTWSWALWVALPCAMLASFAALAAPGTLLTRLLIAASLMVFSALNIHQTGGMIEVHFGIFVLMSFLLCYRDWRPIVGAATVAAIHHLTFNYFQQLGYGVYCFQRPGLMYVLIHAAYVVAEASVLSYLALGLEREGVQAAELEALVDGVDGADGKLVLAATGSARSAAGRALLQVIERLRSTMRLVATGASHNLSASRDIASGNSQLGARTRTQAEHLASTTTALQQLTAIIRRNAEGAQQAKYLVVEASEIATEGGRAFSDVVATMGEIESSSKKIADIIGVIDSIAFQTNLLALNAAVEAARAGDQGRGFAVVAAEVRNLAQRSADAARQIKALIQSSVRSVEAGGSQVVSARSTMDNVVATIRNLATIVTDFSAAFSEQTSGLDEVNGAVRSLNDITRQNTSMVEDAAAAAANLQAQSAELAEALAVFRLDAAQVSALPTARATPALASVDSPEWVHRQSA